MEPTTVAMERMAAEWAALMAGLGSLALWGAVGLIVLLGMAVISATLLEGVEPAVEGIRDSEHEGPSDERGVPRGVVMGGGAGCAAPSRPWLQCPPVYHRATCIGIMAKPLPMGAVARLGVTARR